MAACADPPTPSCAGDLGGTWRARDGRRYHVVDSGDAVEIFGLADTRAGLFAPPPSAPLPASAAYARLERRGAHLAGFTQQFEQRGARVCRVRAALAAERCGGGDLVLRATEPGALDFDDCSQRAPAGERRVRLRRE